MATNREIKFREYRGAGKWHYWGFTEPGKFTGPCSPNSIANQFTGFHDKNGKEIYEGDIIDYDLTIEDETAGHEQGIVKFIDGEWVTQTGDNLACSLFDELSAGIAAKWNPTVIGNIYEKHLK